jgi:probable F420-dependent oxidoreductase
MPGGLSNQVTRDDWLAWARRAEELGYATFQVADHIPNRFGTLVSLMAAAMVTTSLRVGSFVFDNDFRHPALLAKDAATLDVLSGGRLEFGIGAGWNRPADYDPTGIPFDSAGVRISRLAEAVRLIKALYVGGPVTLTGEHYSIKELTLPPSPIQRPYPPIFIGGGGQRMLSLAAREADIVGLVPRTRTDGQGLDHQEAGATATDRQVAWIREAAGDRFPSIEINTCVFSTVVTDDRRQAAEHLARNGRLVAGMTPEQILDLPHVLLGSLDQMVDNLHMWRDRYGISYVTIFGESMEEFAPIVARLAGR